MTAAFQHQQPNRSPRGAPPMGTPEEQRATAASHLAHDARNWLTVLQVYCDLLRSSNSVTGSGRAWMEELSHAVERGQGLVTSLLDSVQTPPSPKSFPVTRTAEGSNPLDLAAALRARESLFRQMAGRGIHVQSKIVPVAKTMALGETEFDRILLNLVRNSIDAMPEGGELKIELEQNDRSRVRPLLLRVTDTGKGIRADLLGHIFESGFSTKPVPRETASGRGYGLAIVRSLVRAAGGTVRVRSVVGEGTSFTIELPAQLAVTPRRRKSHSRQHPPAAKKAARKSARTQPVVNFGAHRKGTRVPC